MVAGWRVDMSDDTASKKLADAINNVTAAQTYQHVQAHIRGKSIEEALLWLKEQEQTARALAVHRFLEAGDTERALQAIRHLSGDYTQPKRVAAE